MPFSRRQMLQSAACGFGYLAFADLFAKCQAGGSQPRTHHAPRARRAIFLFMHGGPSHVDTFDYKTKLQQDDGKSLPFDPAENISAKPSLLASPWKFARQGQSGLWTSELLPEVSKHVDELCVLRSLHSRGQSHGQAVSMMHTGSDNLTRPSVGAWISYGLGAESESLPSFISISPPSGHGGPRNYGSAFLPASHQATTVGRAGVLGEAAIANLRGPMQRDEQRRQLDFVQRLNRRRLEQSSGDRQIEAAIDSMELAFRMQRVAPEVMDLSQEPQHIHDLYGVGGKSTDNYARQCLLARRFAEAGVRYIQVSTRYSWDQHSNLKNGHEKNFRETDKPVAGLLADLKQRGMLDDTLVIWGGEFGRTPIVQGKNGRDHNPQGFTMWMAGAGLKQGFAYGATDEYGYYAVENRVHVHDLHATILHLLGLDHERLTYTYAGRDFRLTDVYGRVVQEILA